MKKYGFWGLMIFVLVPIPGTGVYAGTIAGYLFGLERKKAFLANTIGIFFLLPLSVVDYPIRYRRV
ncbi:small multi-drug export protein [Algoriphagus boritolerans]|uniref:small multi-drug export protein n=1 Tax=Algoriphagus boritolerans TaxID=308111 RepID=UPI002FCE048F